MTTISDLGNLAAACTALDQATELAERSGLIWSGYGIDSRVLRCIAHYAAGSWDEAERVGATVRALRELPGVAEVLVVSDAAAASNIAGLPGIAVPNGFGLEQLPTSLTFTGRVFEENLLIAAASEYQTRTDWHRQRPPIA